MAQCPVIKTVQSDLHFIPWQTCSTKHHLDFSQVSGYLLQAAQSWAIAGVTEDGHCQGACCPQWFFYVSN